MNDNHYPRALWSEILPGLWQGGTDDYDVIGVAGHCPNRVTSTHFDSVYTLYARANAASWNVKEVRFGFADGDMTDFDPEADLYFAVREAHADWKAGKRVLVRCQAGLNRSGLVMALVLIREGYTPEQAVELIRQNRGDIALCNDTFVRWLTLRADVDFWRDKAAA
jgi:Dual specificity phosphatase, catalytic domain